MISIAMGRISHYSAKKHTRKTYSIFRFIHRCKDSDIWLIIGTLTVRMSGFSLVIKKVIDIVYFG